MLQMTFRKFYTFILILHINVVSSQVTRDQLNTISPYMNNFMKIDYFSIKYIFLDKNFKVTMSSIDFEKNRKKYNFPKKASSKDSLSVALMAEFKNWDQARIAELRLTYTWIRLGYHLLLNETESKELGKGFKIKYPWLVKQKISKENTPLTQQVLSDLKKRIKEIDPTIDVSMMSADELMRKALEINPVRKQKYLQEGRQKH